MEGGLAKRDCRPYKGGYSPIESPERCRSLLAINAWGGPKSPSHQWVRGTVEGGLAPKDRQIQRFDYGNATCTQFGSSLTISGERDAPGWL